MADLFANRFADVDFQVVFTVDDFQFKGRRVDQTVLRIDDEKFRVRRAAVDIFLVNARRLFVVRLRRRRR